MTLRAQTIAIIVLLAAIGIVFLMVGDAGVSTGVFLPEPTTTSTPTPTPSPTPLPEASADNWVENNPGELTYVADPTVSATVRYIPFELNTFTTQMGLEPIDENAEFPLLDLLDKLREQTETQITEAELRIGADAFEGPKLEIFDGIPVAILRIKVPEQDTPTGQAFPGRDIAWAFVDLGEGQIQAIQYALENEPDAIVYADFLVWLEGNVADMVGTTEPDEEATEEPEAAATEEPAEEATEEPAETESATEEPEAAATEEPDEEATEEPAADVTEEPEAAATEEPAETESATEEPEAAATEEPVEVATEEPEAAAPPAPTETWMELGPGQLLYAADPNAMIIHTTATLDSLAAQIGVEPPAEDVENPLNELLQQTVDSIQEQIDAVGIEMAEDGLEGPATEEINGVPITYVSLRVEPQTSQDEQPIPGQNLFMALIDLGDRNIRMLQFQYSYEAEENPEIFEDFRTWLEENIDTLATMPEESESAPANE